MIKTAAFKKETNSITAPIVKKKIKIKIYTYKLKMVMRDNENRSD